MTDHCKFWVSRRNFLGLSTALPIFLQQTGVAMAAGAAAGQKEKYPNRILVVLEMSGGNDGLNTVVPYADDAYFKQRPKLAIKDPIKLNDRFGFHPALFGFERLFKDGNLAVVHGCSYPNPDRSHFVSMAFWHTGVPHGTETRGWLGRFADAYKPEPVNQYVVNIGKQQSLAVRGNVQTPVVFSNPAEFVLNGSAEEKEVFAKMFRDSWAASNPALRQVRAMSAGAARSSDFVRNACDEFRTRMEYGYGEIGRDLKKVAALIQAGAPTRIYYVSMGSFDTHVTQGAQHTTLFNQLGDALQGFLLDLKRIGRADDVAVMSFTEFGRRVNENASGGTDHGVASPMFIAGSRVKGGFYSQFPSLTDLDENGDLKMTTDFRSVYATMVKEWMGFDQIKPVLYGDFPTLPVFG